MRALINENYFTTREVYYDTTRSLGCVVRIGLLSGSELEPKKNKRKLQYCSLTLLLADPQVRTYDIKPWSEGACSWAAGGVIESADSCVGVAFSRGLNTENPRSLQ